MKNSPRPSLIWRANCKDLAVSASPQAYAPTGCPCLAVSTSSHSSRAACNSQSKSKAPTSNSWAAST
eukprot:15357075-Alexandrium_andersonii.AAC.1